MCWSNKQFFIDFPSPKNEIQIAFYRIKFPNFEDITGIHDLFP